MKLDDDEDEGGGYNWMDTYGDLVTLLLCFFVLLYSFSSLNEQKWQELVSVFTGGSGSAAVRAFDISSVREEPIVVDKMVSLETRDDGMKDDGNKQLDQKEAQKVQKQINEVFDELYEKVVAYINLNDLSGQVSITRTDETIILRFSEIALFDSGSAEIRPESKETLNHIIQLVAENTNAIKMVNIEGHTDNVPISTAEFRDNWDLSAKRATNTLRILLAANLLDQAKLSAVGYGEYHPIATNDTPKGRSLNRRVDFVLNKVTVTKVPS